MNNLHPGVPSHIVEEVVVLNVELLIVDVAIKQMEARRKWLLMLRDNFLRRFSDGC